MDKENVVHIIKGILFSYIEKNVTLKFVGKWMKLKHYLSKISLSQTNTAYFLFHPNCKHICLYVYVYSLQKWILREKEEILREGGDSRQQQSKAHGSGGKKGNVGNTLRG